MLNQPLSNLTLSLALALATVSAVWAQNAPAPQPVTRVGVTPQASHEAVQKAAPNATATLVRTEPSGAEQDRKKSNDAKSSAKPQKTTPPLTPPKQRANTAPHPGETTNHKTTGTVTNTTTPSAAMGITGTLPGDEATSGEGSPVVDKVRPQGRPAK